MSAERSVSSIPLDIEKERAYAKDAAGWRHGEHTEDMLLQRIWNLAAVIEKACDDLHETRRYLDMCDTAYRSLAEPGIR